MGRGSEHASVMRRRQVDANDNLIRHRLELLICVCGIGFPLALAKRSMSEGMNVDGPIATGRVASDAYASPHVVASPVCLLTKMIKRVASPGRSSRHAGGGSQATGHSCYYPE